MKKTTTTLVVALAIGLISCGGEKTETVAKEAAPEKVETTEMAYTIAADQSSVQWEGTMVGIYSHSGDIKLQSGALMTKDGMVTGGEFVIDMKSINPTDENYSEENPREALIGHLGTGDFFSVDSIPTASFKVTKAEGNSVMGDLTIKGLTQPGTITDVKVEEKENAVMATGKLVFDRQAFGVAYKAANDMVLSDDITLTISLNGMAN
ncbi:YceI family protein [Flavobacteriales bacterium]|nr:YceI family protein [Flavobacteriales bacterium]